MSVSGRLNCHWPFSLAACFIKRLKKSFVYLQHVCLQHLQRPEGFFFMRINVFNKISDDAKQSFNTSTYVCLSKKQLYLSVSRMILDENVMSCWEQTSSVWPTCSPSHAKHIGCFRVSRRSWKTTAVKAKLYLVFTLKCQNGALASDTAPPFWPGIGLQTTFVAYLLLHPWEPTGH